MATLISRTEEPQKYIPDESTHPKPSNIIFHTDNAGTMARVFSKALQVVGARTLEGWLLLINI